MPLFEYSIPRSLRNLDRLSTAICDIEPDRKGVPTLLEQYCKLGGRIIEFNIDTNFGDCLGALIVVALRQTHLAMLSRFMRRETAHSFLGRIRSQAKGLSGQR